MAGSPLLDSRQKIHQDMHRNDRSLAGAALANQLFPSWQNNWDQTELSRISASEYC